MCDLGITNWVSLNRIRELGLTNSNPRIRNREFEFTKSESLMGEGVPLIEGGGSLIGVRESGFANLGFANSDLRIGEGVANGGVEVR